MKRVDYREWIENLFRDVDSNSEDSSNGNNGHTSQEDKVKSNGSKPEENLLEFNENGFLGHVLAAEEHMSQLGGSKIDDSWCIRKHLLLANNHHLSEAIIHAEEIDKKLGEELKEFQKEFKKIMDSPSLIKLRRIRNRFREIIKDKTLTAECPLCKLDYTGVVKPIKNEAAFDKEVVVNTSEVSANNES